MSCSPTAACSCSTKPKTANQIGKPPSRSRCAYRNRVQARRCGRATAAQHRMQPTGGESGPFFTAHVYRPSAQSRATFRARLMPTLGRTLDTVLTYRISVSLLAD
jgi:hypothetical protein